MNNNDCVVAFAQSLGIKNIHFEDSVASLNIQNKGLFSFELLDTGILITHLDKIAGYHMPHFMKEALDASFPLVQNGFTIRPFLFGEEAGLALALSESQCTLDYIGKAVDTLYNAMRNIAQNLK